MECSYLGKMRTKELNNFHMWHKQAYSELEVQMCIHFSAPAPLFLLRAEICAIMVNVLTDFIINLAVVNLPWAKI